MGPLLTIEKLVHGGLGLARTDHGVVFVADVAPGEKVRVVGENRGARLLPARPRLRTLRNLRRVRLAPYFV
jgi:hypothetical protein